MELPLKALIFNGFLFGSKSIAKSFFFSSLESSSTFDFSEWLAAENYDVFGTRSRITSWDSVVTAGVPTKSPV